MALINCPECNKEVSDKAEACPNCGFGVAKHIERQKKILKIQEEAEKEAYLYVKQKKKEEKEKAEQKKKDEINRKNNIYEEAVEKFASESSKDVEKAEELFKSISSWKESEEYLSKCTDRINELKQREIIREENCRRRNKKNIFATVITGVCIGLIIVGYSFYERVVVPRNVYESAIHNIQNEDYEEGIEKLKTITDYKDSVQQIEMASEEIYKRDYSNAKELIAGQKYSDALEILKNLENKDDVAKLINLCDAALRYEEGIALLEGKKYIEAIDLLSHNDFDINGEKINACYIGLAYQEISNKEYDKALEHFKLANYRDEGYQEIYYIKGMDAYEKLDFESAITFFNESLGYKDSEEMITKVENVYYIDEATRNLIDGYWYKPKEDDRGGRVIVINASEQVSKLWTGWDHFYTIEYIKENQEEFASKRTYANDNIINNGDGTYSVLAKDRNGNKIKLITFQITENSLKIVSVFYPKWKSEIGTYSKVM